MEPFQELALRQNIRNEHIDRLLKILDRFSQQLKISLCLPRLLKESSIKEFLCSSEEKRALFRKYSEFFDSQQFKFNGVENGSLALVGEVETTNVDKEELCDLLEVLRGCDQIFPTLNSILEEPSMSEIKELVNYVSLLLEFLEWKLRMTPSEMIDRQNKSRGAQEQIDKANKRIIALKEYVKDEMQEFIKVAESIKSEIFTVETSIGGCKEEHRRNKNFELNEMKNEIKDLNATALVEDQNLENQVEKYDVFLEQFLILNLEEEKALRKKRREIDKCYLDTLKFYDLEVGKFFEMKKSLELELEELKKHHEMLKVEYEIQTPLYGNLQHERELTLMRTFAEKIDNFEKNRAARTIQQCWRAYRERLASRKKKKPRKKQNS